VNIIMKLGVLLNRYSDLNKDSATKRQFVCFDVSQIFNPY
jgi:hypothetical protein